MGGTNTIRVVGAGLAGATVAYLCDGPGPGRGRRGGTGVGWPAADRRGGRHVLRADRRAHLPHRDSEVWQLVTGLVAMRPYRHVVRTEVFGRVLSWPPQLAELRELPQWPAIERELARGRPGRAATTSRPGAST